MVVAAAWTEGSRRGGQETGSASRPTAAAHNDEVKPSASAARDTEDAGPKERNNEPKPPPSPTNSPPSPKPVSEELSRSSEGGPKAVNITIDDGPHPQFTPRMLDVLAEYGAKATFCVVGSEARRYPGLVKRIVAEGHRLCNHAASHDSTMDKKSRSYQAKEILDGARAITEASGGVPPLYYRAPGGAFTAYSRKLAAQHGMRPLGWSVDARDWELPGVDVLVRRVQSQLANGPTVLLHDGGGDRAQSVEALRRLLPWIEQRDRTFGFPTR
ncbi:polysaccharide deacetylase family protein (plasmid) [Streptomyces cadmiisoli]|uniref:Polysaccharide deacetylase family protein n=2 Tax=Streptomyces cadmiisoli TaxID=2184053 RepID=A0A2Z4JD59_9ACTN|nr:polysaccharide deacetylase family protein [Streptomyces cadmiisoli]